MFVLASEIHFVLFFKQKTAYEMRISDWSSDVCSSDLNKVLRAQGYEGLKPLEDKIQAEYDDWLRTRSLRFNLAYCEGFESMSASACEAWFEDFGDFLDGADPVVADMWRWHLAEEFEHRTVCSDVYTELSGLRSEEHTSELQSLMRISYAFFC